MRALSLITACLFALLAQSPQAFGQAGFDRPGGDYTSFTVRSGDPAACAARCEREGRVPRVEFSLSAHRRDPCGLLAQEQRHHPGRE